MARSPLHQLTGFEVVNAGPAAKHYALSDGGRLYVSCQAVAILRDLYSLTGPESYVFPSRKAGLPMSAGTISAALRTIGYSGHEMTGHGFQATGRAQIRSASVTTRKSSNGILHMAATRSSETRTTGPNSSTSGDG